MQIQFQLSISYKTRPHILSLQVSVEIKFCPSASPKVNTYMQHSSYQPLTSNNADRVDVHTADVTNGTGQVYGSNLNPEPVTKMNNGTHKRKCSRDCGLLTSDRKTIVFDKMKHFIIKLFIICLLDGAPTENSQVYSNANEGGKNSHVWQYLILKETSPRILTELHLHTSVWHTWYHVLYAKGN